MIHTHGLQPGSAQTVARVPHNDHEWNQRNMSPSTGFIEFVHKTERHRAFNSGKKPVRYKFGNLVVVRTDALIEQCTFFAHPSQSFEIPWPYQMDIDDEKDFLLAEAARYSPHGDSHAQAHVERRMAGR